MFGTDVYCWKEWLVRIVYFSGRGVGVWWIRLKFDFWFRWPPIPQSDVAGDDHLKTAWCFLVYHGPWNKSPPNLGVAIAARHLITFTTAAPFIHDRHHQHLRWRRCENLYLLLGSRGWNERRRCHRKGKAWEFIIDSSWCPAGRDNRSVDVRSQEV